MTASLNPTSSPPASEFDRAIQYLRKTDPAISGHRGHDHTLKTIGLIKGHFPSLSDTDLLDVLKAEWNDRCDPPWSDRELIHKITSAVPAIVQPQTECRGGYQGWDLKPRKSYYLTHSNQEKTGGYQTGDKQKPEPDPDLIKSIINKSPCNGVYSFIYQSKPLPDKVNPHFYINEIYKPDDLICIGRRMVYKGKVTYPAKTKTLKEWQSQSLTEYQYIVPNPMTAKTGKTLDGDDSPRCSGNAGNMDIQVIEIDPPSEEGPLSELLTPHDNQAKIIHHLSEFAPILLLMHSGGKSLHAWFKTGGNDESEKLLNYAVRLGADSSLKDRSKLVRLPDGTRPADDTPKFRQGIHYTGYPQIQRVFYLNPQNLK